MWVIVPDARVDESSAGQGRVIPSAMAATEIYCGGRLLIVRKRTSGAETHEARSLRSGCTPAGVDMIHFTEINSPTELRRK